MPGDVNKAAEDRPRVREEANEINRLQIFVKIVTDYFVAQAAELPAAGDQYHAPQSIKIIVHSRARKALPARG